MHSVEKSNGEQKRTGKSGKAHDQKTMSTFCNTFKAKTGSPDKAILPSN